MSDNKDKEDQKMPAYGVCDSPLQLAQKFPDFTGNVWFCEILRKNQQDGGWRWHKWGDYVGEYDLSNIEYLSEANGEDGAPLIDVQYLFSNERSDNFLPLQNVFGLPPYELYELDGGKVVRERIRVLVDSVSFMNLSMFGY